MFVYITQQFENCKVEINHHHLNRYLRFIQHCDSVRHDRYTENHHILPKSVFPAFKRFADFPWNCVKLSGREHFIAHWMLSRVFQDTRLKAKMLKAFFRMSVTSSCHKGGRTVSSKLYQRAKEANSEAMKANNPMHDPVVLAKMKVKLCEFRNSPEGLALRQRLSESRRGVDTVSKEGKQRLSELWLGVPRPKRPGQIEKSVKSSSCAIYHTPFGDFHSPTIAAQSPSNVDGAKGHTIRNRCRGKYGQLPGWSVTQLREDSRGAHNKSIKPEIE